MRWKSLYLMICMRCESFFVDDLRKWPNDPYGPRQRQLAPKGWLRRIVAGLIGREGLNDHEEPQLGRPTSS